MVIVEDGSIVANANSYDSVENIEAFALARGVTLTGTETLIYKAMDWIEAQSFQGWKYTKDQALAWPRSGVVIDNWALTPITTIPKELKKTLALQVMSIFAGINPQDPIERTTKAVNVGPIKIEYSDNAADQTINPAVSDAIAKLLGGNGNGFEFDVGRDADKRFPNYYDDLGWFK